MKQKLRNNIAALMCIMLSFSFSNSIFAYYEPMNQKDPGDKIVEIEAEDFEGTDKGFSVVEDSDASGGKIIVGGGNIENEAVYELPIEGYETRTLHDSSLSMCIHALVAARLGMNEMAAKLFYDSCCVDLGDNTNNSDAGIHSASIGGIWLALVMGYSGLKVSETGLSIDPILPEGWNEYSFYVSYQGAKIKVTVNTDGCHLVRVFGDEVRVMLNGKEIAV